MADTILSKKVVVNNAQGLHARPANMLVQLANQFQSTIEFVTDDGLRVDGKSILSILTLAATQGTVLYIEASGPDAKVALDELSNLVENVLAENEVSEQE